MAAKITTNRVVICADPNCGKELPIGSEVLMYGSGARAKYYGTTCHTVSKEEKGKRYIESKMKAKAMLQKRNVKEFLGLMSTRVLDFSDVITLLRASKSGTLSTKDQSQEDYDWIINRVSSFDEKTGIQRAWKELVDHINNGTQLGEHWEDPDHKMTEDHTENIRN